MIGGETETERSEKIRIRKKNLMEHEAVRALLCASLSALLIFIIMRK